MGGAAAAGVDPSFNEELLHSTDTICTAGVDSSATSNSTILIGK